MNKKAQWQDLADLFLGGTLIIMAVLGFIIWVSFNDGIIEERVEKRAEALNNDDVLVSFLNTEIDDRTLSEWIIRAHIDRENNSTEFEEVLDTFLADVYQHRTCWTLYRQDEEWIKKEPCSEEADLLDSAIDIPLPDKTALNIRLNIKGYAE
ncbi:TPA: hypothetical protein HA239_04045 [Candidatus Woesearchaeota archaeon]|nr:hypothetical protein QT06_C0001G0774 [archaeon GW2011_AR15]MBS3103446.1 hypothetical protein [Candidatus Woesearchaeota archaeon]HIH41564.1 hypothetical protein [Candidatus Woesearchaeota archaeon]